MLGLGPSAPLTIMSREPHDAPEYPAAPLRPPHRLPPLRPTSTLAASGKQESELMDQLREVRGGKFRDWVQISNPNQGAPRRQQIVAKIEPVEN